MEYKYNCSECGDDFVRHYKISPPRNGAKNHKKYCSKECRQKSRAKERTYIKCSNCNTNIRYYNSEQNKFCSNKCQGEWMKQHSQKLGLAERASKARESWTEESWKKSIQTRTKNGNIVTQHDWKQYWKRCDYLTRKIRKQMLQEWDGYDYIDGEHIKENLHLHYSHKNYPTLDHVVPRSKCFQNGLSPDEATSPSNLKWTKRVNNSKKYNN